MYEQERGPGIPPGAGPRSPGARSDTGSNACAKPKRAAPEGAGRIVESSMDDDWRSREVVIVAETGCDVPATEARKLGVYLVPMHVIFGHGEHDDGTFPPSRIEEYRQQTGMLPRTAACSPADFSRVFERIRREHPTKTILHLAYSAKTTSSFANAIIAAREIPGVIHLDTQAASSGQGAIVRQIARFMAEHPGVSAHGVAQAALRLSQRLRFGFVPAGLDYLRAGGRLSNAAYVAGTFLHMHPIISLKDGLLVATQKVCGSMRRACYALIDEVAAQVPVDPASIFLLRSPGLSERVAALAQEHVAALGCANPTWYETGGVITAHCGPGAVGIGCFAE